MVEVGQKSHPEDDQPLAEKPQLRIKNFKIFILNSIFQIPDSIFSLGY